MNHDLLRAIDDHDVEAVRRLARATDLNTSDPELGEAPYVRYALRGDRPEVLRILLDEGAPPDVPDRFGQTPLIHAASCDTPAAYEAAQMLLDAGADPNHASNNGVTPLLICIFSPEGSPETFRLLLERGADPTRPGPDPGDTVSTFARDEFRTALADFGFPA